MRFLLASVFRISLLHSIDIKKEGIFVDSPKHTGRLPVGIRILRYKSLISFYVCFFIFFLCFFYVLSFLSLPPIFLLQEVFFEMQRHCERA